MSIRKLHFALLFLFFPLIPATAFSYDRAEFAPLTVINQKKYPASSLDKTTNNFRSKIRKRGKRGRRGKKGHRGHKGSPGDSAGCGLGELFMTASELVGCGEGPNFPSNFLLSPYDPCLAVVVWDMFYIDGMVGHGASGTFNIPIDLDNTQPVTAVIHLLVEGTEGQPIGSNANIQVNMAYLSNNQVGGIISPATGYSDTQISGDFTVTPPDTVADGNIRQLSIAIPLDATAMAPGDWAYIVTTRIPASTNEYEDYLWLSTLSIQYSRTCS